MKKEVWNNGSLICEKYYAGSFVYNNEGLEYILFDEGRLTPKADSTYQYEYFLKDHLGNTRVVFTGQEEGLAVLQENHYYPFGMEFMGVGGEQMDITNYYKYNGKELQDDGFDLDENGVYESRLLWYDYGARFYDAVLGRWHVPDPLAENHYDFTPYNYVLNNPLLIIDPFGMDTTVYVLDQAENPDNKRVYTADVYVDVDGKINGPYKGSSFPNDDSKHNTLKDGEYEYNNESGHDGGTEKGLNIVNEDGERKADGTDPEGNDVEMTAVNVHSGVKPEDDPAGLNRENRGSAGCPTVKPSESKAFFKNFNWNTGTGQNSNTGISTGKTRISRDQKYNTKKKNYFEMIKKTQLNKGI